ncbi:MAG: MaoC family dehydratase [Bacillota bacterium]
MERKSYDSFHVGDTASFSKTITESDVSNYAGITGDFNPVHIDQEYAKNSFFKDRIVHGMLSAGLISAVLGTKLPGPGAIYLSQDLKFRKPVKINDTITAKVEVTEKKPEKKILKLKTICFNQKDDEVLTGNAEIMLNT